MRWRTGRRSSNVEDRRGASAGGRLPGLFPRRLGRIGGRRGGKGSLLFTVLLLLGMYMLGIDPRILLQSGGIPGGGDVTGLSPGQSGATYQPTAEENELADFVSVVLADTEDTWHPIFRDSGQTYQEPGLVLFSGAVRSGCGMAQSAMGPFYCPLDEKIYIDLDFYRELKNRHGAPGDFAQAYVIAHEVGHHVQHLLGISDKVQSARQNLGEEEGNRLSVRLELQADCLAGVWGKHADRARQILEEGDIEEALNAASSIGDDRLQRQATGRIQPEGFTHGTSEQRVRWFRRGIEKGDIGQCDTFAAERL